MKGDVVSVCGTCGAEKVDAGGYLRQFHAPGCTRTGIPFGGHLETAMVIEQSKARDAAQSAAGNHRLNNASPLKQRKR